MLDCMRSRKLPNADVAIGAEVAKLSHMANISSRVGKALHWDNETGTSTTWKPTGSSKPTTVIHGNCRRCDSNRINLIDKTGSL